METGQNKFPPEPFTYLKRNGDKTQIQSVGLIFEPDFFTLYAYGDRQGHDPIGFSTLSIETSPNEYAHPILHEPLYALAYTPHWTLVPRAIFREGDAWEHLQFNTAATEMEKVAFDSLPLLDAVLVHQTRPDAEERLAILSPGLQMRHFTTVALELMFRSVAAQKDSPFIWIHLLGGQAMVVVGKDRLPILANSIEMRFVEDLEYYVLFAAKQLKLDTRTPIHVSGYSTHADKLKSALNRYFDTLTSPPVPTATKFETPEQSLLTRHFMGLYAPICAS